MRNTNKDRRASAGWGTTSTRPSSTLSNSGFGNSAISRGQFVKGLGYVGGAVAAAGLAWGGVAHATGGTTTVVGTNTSPTDANAIHKAINIDGYDVVYLQGTFNFGTTDSVLITKDVEIIGQGATIYGGKKPIYSNSGVSLAVRNIRFEDATSSAICVTKLFSDRRLEVSNCTIVNVKLGSWLSYPLAIPIAVYTYESATPGNQDNLTGDVLISGNYLDQNVNEDPAYFAYLQGGIWIGMTRANITISNNEIYHGSYGGLAIDQNAGTTTISDNIVHPGMLPSAPGFPDSFGQGMWLGLHNAWGPQGSILVTGNEVKCVNPNADGICLEARNVVPGTSSVISNNHVIMENSTCGALTCYYSIKNSVWTNNNVEGSMVWAIGVLPINPAYIAEHNVFKGNNVARVTLLPLGTYGATAANVLFMENANYNTLVGFSGTVADDGIGNTITGYTKIGRLNPTLGQTIKDAVAKKHAAMEWE